MRRASWARILVPLLSLPSAGSALILLSIPPISPLVPPSVKSAVRPLVNELFDLMARLPRDSLAGRAFFGSYDALVPLLGANALAVHSALTSLPALALAIAVAVWARRGRRPRPTPGLFGDAQRASPKG